METVTSAAVIVAVVDAIKRLVPEKVQGLTTIVVAVLAGVVVAVVTGDTSVVQGAVNGLVAVGAVATVSRVGK